LFYQRVACTSAARPSVRGDSRSAADRGELAVPPRRRAVLETGIALHRWWEQRWRELEGGALLE